MSQRRGRELTKNRRDRADDVLAPVVAGMERSEDWE